MSGREWRRFGAVLVAAGAVVSSVATTHADEWDYVYGSVGPLDYSEYLDVVPLTDGSAFLIGAYSGNFEQLSAGVSYRMFAQYRSPSGAMVWTSELDPALGGCATTPSVDASGVDADGVAYIWVTHCDTRGIASMTPASVTAFTATALDPMAMPDAATERDQFGIMPQGVVYLRPGDMNAETPHTVVHLNAQLDTVAEVPLPAPFDGVPGDYASPVPSLFATRQGKVWVAQTFPRPLPHLNDYLGLLEIDTETGSSKAIQHFGYGCFGESMDGGARPRILRVGEQSVWVHVCVNSAPALSSPLAVAFDPVDGHLLGEVASPDGVYFYGDSLSASRSGDWLFEPEGSTYWSPAGPELKAFKIWRVDGAPGNESVALAREVPYNPAELTIGAADGVGDQEFILAGAARSGAAIDLQSAAQSFAQSLDGEVGFTQAANGNLGAFAMRAPVDTPGIISIDPVRVLDTRIGKGISDQNLVRLPADSTWSLGFSGADSPVPVRDATGVVLTVTAVNPAAAGYVSVFPCQGGSAQVRPAVSSVNYSGPGVVVPNTVFVKLGNFAVCFYTKAETDLIIDVNGYLPRATLVQTVAPQRLIDTRSTGQRVSAGGTLELDVAGNGGVAADAGGAILNVTAVNPDGPGYLTAYPCGGEVPKVSNVNWQTAGDVVANAAFVKIGDAGKVCLFAKSATDVVVDVNGFSAVGPAVNTVEPVRVVDTRAVNARLGAETTFTLPIRGVAPVGADATGVLLNVTAVDPSAPGYITAYPCGGPVPTASNVNFTTAGQTVASSVVVKLNDSGLVCFFAKSATDLVIDVNGYTT